MTSRRLATALALCVPLALTACGSGRSPETYVERPTVDAARASVGDLQLRNVRVDAPAAGEGELAVGGDATASMAIVNTGEGSDRLTAVSTADATSVDLAGPDGTAVTKVDIPGLGAIGSSDFTMTLRGLTRAIRPGEHVELTFSFVRGGRTTLLVPVGTFRSPAAQPSENPFEETEGAEG
ncbi:MAG: copper chaperone PCu(A)C [Actinobacteria bacterium]|nr:copper chaperone PCu(A)C [Actinomycetota bacterium]MCA1720040.1 copper chaperone PCu(A)C [Actinomycetota bacterium]